MARKANSSSRPKKKAASPSQKKGRSASGSKPTHASQGKSRILDDRSKRDIIAVICVILAIALLFIAIMPTSAVVSSWISMALHLVFGLGCYILPLFLIVVAVAMFLRSEEARVPVRVAIGLSLLFICILIMFGLYTPGVEAENLNALFFKENMEYQGGAIGAAFAWILLSLVGKAVATVIVIGVIVISLIVVGFTVSSVIDRIKARSERKLAEEADQEVAPAPSYKTAKKFPLPIPQLAAASKEVAPNAAAEEQVTQRIHPVIQNEARPTVPVGGKDTLPISPDATAPLRASSKQMTRKLGTKRRPASGNATQPVGGNRMQQASAMPHPSKDFQLPPMSLLRVSDGKRNDRESAAVLRDTALLLQETLSDFGVDAKVVDWVAGPTVTLFKIDLPSGVRVSKVSNLTDDIALALASPGVRIFSPVPGTNYVGIEVPNLKRETVLLGDVLSSAPDGPLQIAIGKDVEGTDIVTDLSKMPHLLIGGTTGSGKSVAINAMIMSILMRATPAEVRFIMIDPKRVEFTPYNGIPHLFVPVVTECREAASALSWAVAEMERRLKVFSKIGARNISQYNAKAQNGMLIGDEPAEEMPYMVIVIDELADLMMNVGKEVEMSISRLAQLARAAGIHMIVATQRPSTNVVTGLIKANITNRIAFNVASGIDSRVILDQTGAENLIGLGDMLMSKPEYSKPQRLQACYVDENEINDVVEVLKQQGEPDYHSEILNTNIIQMGSTAPDGSGGRGGAPNDPLLWDAAEIVVSTGLGSTSNIQRRLSVGYARAGRIMDMLEEIGVVGPPNGSKPREVLVDEMELETLKAFEQNDSD